VILYKYLSPDRINVLTRRRIRFTQPGEFNDPFEARPAFGPALISDEQANDAIERGIEHALDQVLASPEVAELLRRAGPPTAAGSGLDPRTALRTFLADSLKLPDFHATHFGFVRKVLEPIATGVLRDVWPQKMDENVGLLCLSERADSVLMWGHYADCHKGLVLGFDSESPFFSKKRGPNDEFGHLRKVVYQQERPTIDFTIRDSGKLSAMMFHTKSGDWGYEREWRMMRVLTDCTNRIDSSPFPICLFEFQRECLREIIIGMRMSQEKIDEVRAHAREFANAMLCRAQVHPTEYALVIEEIR